MVFNLNIQKNDFFGFIDLLIVPVLACLLSFRTHHDSHTKWEVAKPKERGSSIDEDFFKDPMNNINISIWM